MIEFSYNEKEKRIDVKGSIPLTLDGVSESETGKSRFVEIAGGYRLNRDDFTVKGLNPEAFAETGWIADFSAKCSLGVSVKKKKKSTVKTETLKKLFNG